MSESFPGGISAALGEKLKIARDATRMSTREVAERVAARCQISHATIANYEKARSTPSLEVLDALADLYGKSLNWFLSPGPRLSGVRYRNLKSKVKTEDRRWFEANAQRWLEAYVKLESFLAKPLKRELEISPSQNEGGQAVAIKIRKALKINDTDPLISVIDVLERFAIRSIELPTDLHVDGIAARFGEEFAVVLNPSTHNDRSRLNAGHELGHVLFGDVDKPESKDNKKLEEDRTYELAFHLIMPESQLREAFRGQSMVRLVQFKERFGVSLAAMVYRAEKLKIITASIAKWLWIEFARRGWRAKEPGVVRADRATRFEQLLDGAIAKEKLTWKSAADLMGVREEETRERVNQAMGLNNQAAEEGGLPPEEVLQFPR